MQPLVTLSRTLFVPLGDPANYTVLRHLSMPYSSSPRLSGITCHSRADSDLEAFSHNPTDDSFASLPGRANAKPNIQINGSSRTESNKSEAKRS